MGERQRSEISKNNAYWINRERYLELLHFCRQYDIWSEASKSLLGLSSKPVDLERFRTNDISDPVAKCAEAREYFINRMKMVEQAAIETDSELYLWLMDGIIHNKSYEELHPPCSKGTYYNRYRKFFYILNKVRD